MALARYGGIVQMPSGILPARGEQADGRRPHQLAPLARAARNRWGAPPRRHAAHGAAASGWH
eukprot:7903465-Pyramimonas_sp.AAC.1